MQLDELKSTLSSAFPEAKIEVQIDGSHFAIDIVSDVFEGMRPVKRQQLVYAAIGNKITDGSMHAVHMKLSTPAQKSALDQ